MRRRTDGRNGAKQIVYLARSQSVLHVAAIGCMVNVVPPMQCVHRRDLQEPRHQLVELTILVREFGVAFSSMCRATSSQLHSRTKCDSQSFQYGRASNSVDRESSSFGHNA